MADPTVTDVFNQLVLVNGKLDQVEVNTSVISNLNASLNLGFSATVQALETVALVNIEAVKLLYHQSQQTDTMICALEHISKNTCEILTQVTIQTNLQSDLRDDLSALRFVAESTQPAAALDLQRRAEAQSELERCCPPEQPPPACEYEPCDAPKPAAEPKLPKIRGGGSDNPDQPNK